MKMKVVKDISVEKWDEILSKSQHSTFFQTYLWVRILEESYKNYKTATRLFIFEDGLELLVPCMEIKLDVYGLRKKYESMAFGTYGGFICNNRTVTALHINQIIRNFKTSKMVSISFNLNPLSNTSIKYPLEGSVTPTYTHVLSLEKGFDFIWQTKFRSKVRNRSRKAEKNGVEVYTDNSAEGFKEYYTIYATSSKRWGKDKPDYPLKLFETINELGNRHVKLWMAKVHSKVIAGALNFYYGDNISYWSGAMLKEYSAYCPNDLLFKTAVLDGCREGYLYFNFGASGDLDGVRKFKESFGANKVDYNIYHHDNKDISCKLYQKGLGICKRIRRFTK